MDKHEAIRKLYGENPPFSYDTALPQSVLDGIANESTIQFQDDSDGWSEKQRRKAYNRIYFGCVYAYDKNGSGQGFLPLTKEARLELQCSSYAIMIYVPVID